MRAMRRLVRIALGLVLLLHGLGNAVLPLRGMGLAASGRWSPLAAAVSVAAIGGFIGAGLAVLGVRPLHRNTIWFASTAGICSLAAQAWLGQTDLWIGAALSLALPVAAGFYATGLGERRASGASHTRVHLAADALGMAFLAWMTASALLFPINRSWGTVPEEWLMALPHDRSPRTAEFELLHGVTIDAPPATVWAWLVQLGQDRAGFYSYDRLERSFGADVHNLTELRAEWQSRQVGDRVFATQPGYLGGVLGDRPGWKVLLAEPGEALVLENWGAFVLLPDGHGGTRFLIRSTVSNADIPAWAAALNLGAFQLPHFIMQRRMMLNIKSLAEQTSRTGRIGSVSS